jgi:catechol 2,3-dioxygenase-like lactoylglutathione lyase family enzyme
MPPFYRRPALAPLERRTVASGRGEEAVAVAVGLEAARAELRPRGIEFHEGDYGVAWSVYLPDPDGYQVEITTYEPTGE